MSLASAMDTFPAFTSGRRGESERGDVWMGYTPASSLQVDFQSRLAGMFGVRTEALLRELLQAAGIRSGHLQVEDSGAYPFLLRARLESLLVKATGNPSLRLPTEAPLAACPPPRGERERSRRSRLYLPGNEAKYMLNAACHHPDGVILDLEDAVAPEAKEDARAVVRHALHHLDWGDCERMVRINQGAMGLEDLAYLAEAPVDLWLLPKIESAAEVQVVAAALRDREQLLMPIIESARGVLAAEAIATADLKVVALTLGLEDLTADLGVVKTAIGHETLWARSMVLYAAKAHGLQAIDSVYGDVGDEAGFRASLQEAKALGFEGKGCVHPRQVAIVHQELAPSSQEIERACAIVRAFEEAQAQGLAVVALGSKMIDPPVVKRAQKTVEQALQQDLLEVDWRSV